MVFRHFPPLDQWAGLGQVLAQLLSNHRLMVASAVEMPPNFLSACPIKGERRSFLGSWLSVIFWSGLWFGLPQHPVEVLPYPVFSGPCPVSSVQCPVSSVPCPFNHQVPHVQCQVSRDDPYKQVSGYYCRYAISYITYMLLTYYMVAASLRSTTN